MKKIKIHMKIKSLKMWLKLLFASPSEKRHSLVGPPYLWKMKRDFQIQFLKHGGLQPEHYLLDLGCGTLRGGIPLIKYLQKEHYYGTEVRAKVLKEAKKELQEANLESQHPTLIWTKEISSLHIDRKFDFIWAFSVLIHMTDEILNDCLSFVGEYLKNTGYFYANVKIAESWDGYARIGFPIVVRPMKFYEEASFYNGLQVVDMGTIESLGFKSGDESHNQFRMLKFYRA